MTIDSGRDNPALAKAEPVSRLGPSGFDPARIGVLHGAWIGNLELSTRAWGVFKRLGINSVGEIDDMTDSELLALRGFGDGTLRDTRSAVNRFRSGWHRHAIPFQATSERTGA